MPATRRELVSRGTRRAFREYLSGASVLREIEGLFEDEGLARAEGVEINEAGQRRCLVEEYYAAVDWTSIRDVAAILRVYASILRPLRQSVPTDEYAERSFANLCGYLRRDGFELTQRGEVKSTTAASLVELPVEALSDARSIEEHLGRLGDEMDSDPAGAISSAKSLIEATTKLVLRELGVSFDETADVPALVKAAQTALKLHPESIAPDASGAETVKRILSNLSQLAIGVAELRNLYGRDHGRSDPPSNLRPRHAHLAVGAAHTYCRLLLETLADADAPWNRQDRAS